MPLKNFYDSVRTTKQLNPGFKTHHISVPFRALIAAPSGAGKTNLALNLITLMSGTFHEIIVSVLSKDEPLYQLLGQLEGVRFVERGAVPDMSDFERTDEHGNIKRKDNKQRLLIFDDLVLNKLANRKIADYYIKGRKLGLSLLYLSQSFYQMPKVIRINCQYLILGKNLLVRDLNTICREFPTNMSPDEFTAVYEELTEEPLSSIIIDITKRTMRPNIVGETIEL